MSLLFLYYHKFSHSFLLLLLIAILVTFFPKRINEAFIQTSLPFNLKSSYLIFLLSNVLTILLAAFKILCDKACVM